MRMEFVSTRLEMTKSTAENSQGRKSRGICCFLLGLLEDESYSYVQWTNKEKGEFQIRWMHASSGAWEMKTDAETFRLWAKSKGKLQGREDNYKTWKANFRCAMKSRHEIEEILLPKGHKKKNLKFWKFIDMELVNRYKDGQSLNWRRPRRKSISRKSSVVVSNKRSRRNKRIAEAENNVDKLEETETLPPCTANCDSWSSSTQSTCTTTVLQPTYETERTADKCVDMEDDELDSYGAGLLQIIARGNGERESTESVVPNMPASIDDYSSDLLDYEHLKTTENSSFLSYGQLSPFHQNPSLSTEESFSAENLLLEQDWELFGDLQMEEKFKERLSTAIKYLDNPSEDLSAVDDPFLYEGIYTEL